MSTYLCPRCGKTTEMQTGIDFEDGEQHFDLFCPHCGMQYEVTIPDEKPEPQTIGNQGFGNCPFCGGYLGWSCDFMRSEWTGEELSEEDDTLVQDCFCPNCGARITALYPKEEQVEN